MKSIKNILCAVDPTTDAQPAFHRASWLATKSGAELNLVISVYDGYLSGERFYDAPSLETARDELIDRNKQYLEKLAAPLREAGVATNTDVVWDHPLYESITRYSSAMSADIVFKDAHHHSALDRALLTNTDWNLIRTCPVPLWLVKPRDVQSTPVVLAAIDPTHQHDKPAALDDDILRACAELAKHTGAAIHAFHCYDPRIAFASATANAYIPVSMPYEEIAEDMRELHGKRFDEVVSSHGIPTDRQHLICGATEEELPVLANSMGADVVVMGAIARNLWNRVFVGATAERTLEHLPCDLLIIKPDWLLHSDESESSAIA